MARWVHVDLHVSQSPVCPIIHDCDRAIVVGTNPRGELGLIEEVPFVDPQATRTSGADYFHGLPRYLTLVTVVDPPSPLEAARFRVVVGALRPNMRFIFLD